jgi:hypothetical protein
MDKFLLDSFYGISNPPPPIKELIEIKTEHQSGFIFLKYNVQA